MLHVCQLSVVSYQFCFRVFMAVLATHDDIQLEILKVSVKQ